MTIIEKGKYAAKIMKTMDGGFTVINLYNYNGESHDEPNVYSMKEYKTIKAAERAAAKYLNSNFCQPEKI